MSSSPPCVIDAVLSVYDFFRNLFRVRNYRVRYATLKFTRNEESACEDITYEYKQDGPVTVMREKAAEVTDFVFHVTYTFNAKDYVYVTRNPNHVFPPPKTPLLFRVPIKDAFLLDAYGVPVYNVTRDMTMYEGPHTNFHGETIQFRDIFDLECPTIQLVSILGTVVEYDIATDSISHQTIWLRGKT